MTYGANRANKFLQLPNQTLWSYNAWDSYVTAHLALALRREMKDPRIFKSQWDYFRRWVVPLKRAVYAMQQRGIQVDRRERTRYAQALRGELHEVDEEIRRAADAASFQYTDKFPNSDNQVRKLLFGTLGLKPAGKTETGKPSVNQSNLLRIRRDLRRKDEPHRPLIDNLLHRSRLQTISERYLGFTTDPDGRLRPTVKMTGTVTFRYAYADPALQQFPEETRRFLCAKPGHVLVSIDKAQLEARLLAVFSGDKAMLRSFAQGEDIHKTNALDLFSYSEEYWGSLRPSTVKATRNYSKSYIYKLTYGGSGSTDMVKIFCPCWRCEHKHPPTLQLTTHETAAAEERWFRAHPAVPKWQRQLIESVRRNHYYDSPFGLRRWISASWSRSLEREVKNIPFQMNAALHMNQCQVKLHAQGAPIILQHHDSFLFELPESPPRVLEQRVADYRGVMEEPVPELGNTAFPVDVEWGRNWASHDPETNPHGLRAW